MIKFRFKGSDLGKMLFLLLICWSWISIEALTNETEVNGHEMFFKQSHMELSIPLTRKTVKTVKEIALVKFNMEDLRVRPNQKIRYNIKRNVSWLGIDPEGYLRFTSGAPKTLKSFIVYATKKFDNKTKTTKAKVAVNVYYTKNDKAAVNFCHKHACFWDKIQYRVLEGSYINSNKIIGDLAPNIYQDFCPDYQIEYTLIHTTNFIKIQDGKMYATGVWNYDSLDGTGPRLQPEVSCQIKSTKDDWSQVVNKTMDIRVVDLNDNPMQLVNNITLIEYPLASKFFQNGTYLYKYLQLMAWDTDTVQVNRRFRHSLLNDTREIYHVTCIKRTETFDVNQNYKTGIYCSFQFNQDGSYARLHYCVTLQIREFLHDNTKIVREVVVCAKVGSLKEITDFAGPEGQALVMRTNPAVHNIVLANDPPSNGKLNPSLATFYDSEFLRTVSGTKKMYYNPPSHFTYRSLNSHGVTDKPKNVSIMLEEFFKQNPEWEKLRAKREVTEKFDLATDESDVGVFKKDTIILSIYLGGLFLFFGIFVGYLWWWHRVGGKKDAPTELEGNFKAV